MPITALPWRRRDAASERGAGLVEAAFVIPILFGLIFGIMEIGGALKSYSSAANAVRAGARMASVAGNDAMADQLVLERLAKEASGLGTGEIEYVVIWRSSGPGDSVPAACVRSVPANPNQSSAGVPGAAVGACNIYFRPDAPNGAFDMAEGKLGPARPPEYFFGCSASTPADQVPHKVDCYFPGSSRKVEQSPRGATPVIKPDFVGVHIRASHRYYTGVLGDTLTITESGINLLEPQNYRVGVS